MALTRDDANILSDVIDVATESNWPNIAATLVDRGYSPEEVEKAAGKLATLAGRTNPICAGDF